MIKELFFYLLKFCCPDLFSTMAAMWDRTPSGYVKGAKDFEAILKPPRGG